MSTLQVKTHRGLAGQVSYSVKGIVTFSGSVYGGPVVMVLPSGIQTFVTDPGRFGVFGPEWVRRFMESS